MPRGLTAEGKSAYKVIRSFLTRKHMICTGGCRAFLKPEDFQKREKPPFGIDGAVLVIVYDGGDLAVIFNPAYEQSYKYLPTLATELQKEGFWVEPVTHWYSFVYKIVKPKDDNNTDSERAGDHGRVRATA